MLYHLDQTEGIAGFLLSNGALEDEDTVAIREKLVDKDKVEAIFILPREMFYGTDTSVSMWILNQNKKGGQWHGRTLRNRSGEVLFVDLRRWNENTSTIKTDKSKKTFVVFSDEQIAKIVKIYRDWQVSSSDKYEQPELFRAANKAEIKKNNWSLVPSRYIEFIDRDMELDYAAALSSAAEKMRSLVSAQKENEVNLVEAFKVLGYGK